jgi:hypothetical protein
LIYAITAVQKKAGEGKIEGRKLILCYQLGYVLTAGTMVAVTYPNFKFKEKRELCGNTYFPPQEKQDRGVPIYYQKFS